MAPNLPAITHFSISVNTCTDATKGIRELLNSCYSVRRPDCRKGNKGVPTAMAAHLCKHLYRLDWVLAGRGLAGEHQRVRLLPNRVGTVRNLSTCRHRNVDH
jgi:hypothetical protein